MFTVEEHPEFTHEVKVLVPVDGGHEEQSFKCRFRVVDEPDQADLLKPGGVMAFVRRIVVTMDDLADAKGKALVWSDAVRDRIIAMPHVRIALLKAYRSALAGERAGN